MHVPVKTIISVCISVLVVGILLAFTIGGGKGGFAALFKNARTTSFVPEDGVYQDNAGMDFLAKRKPPVIRFRAKKVRVNEKCPAQAFVQSVTDADGKNLLSALKADGEQLNNTAVFCAAVPGVYFITYTITDEYGLKTEKDVRVIVEY